jgi:hypothetical protein
MQVALLFFRYYFDIKIVPIGVYDFFLILDAKTCAGIMQAFFKKLFALALFDYGLHKMMR